MTYVPPTPATTINVTPELRGRVRYHLAYPDPGDGKIFSLASFPGQIAAQMTVDAGLALLADHQLPLLLTLLDRCDKAEEYLAEAMGSIEVLRAKGLEINPDALETLERHHDLWADRIAGLLRCGRYKWAPRASSSSVNSKWHR